ncbi:MAG: hypothetical protein B6D68_00595 [spirochete symbiont of Stewartia floridana]|nr:MAG: hypothetical protein B6D68_00595 [spirochete symbiont of Stewartia floridana]
MKMISFCTLLLLTSCFIPYGQEAWTVMTWNVQNLFDAVDNGDEYPEFDPGSGDWNSRLFKRRLDRVAEVVVKTVPGGADLVVFQEIENGNVLEQLLEGPLKGRGYDYALSIPGFGIIRCGIISRHPIEKVNAVDCGEWFERSLRPALSFSVRIGEKETVNVIALHWKSPRGNRAATEEPRRREARIVRDMVRNRIQADPEAAILILGDLNTPGDGLIRPAALGPYGLPAGEAVLWRTDVAEFPPFDTDEIVLYDPEPVSGPPGTYNYRGDWDRPDRALLSSGLVQGSGLLFLGARVGELAVMLDNQGHPLRWRTDLEEGYSDHLPLILEFEFVDTLEENAR